MGDFPRLDIWNEPSPFQNSQAYEQKNHNWDVLRNYGDYIGSYINGLIDGWDVRFSAQLNQIPQPNEVIDARINTWGHTFPNLHDHLVDIEENSLRFEPSSHQLPSSNLMAGIILRITDLSTTSNRLKYHSQGNVAFDLPRSGFMTMTTNDLAVMPD